MPKPEKYITYICFLLILEPEWSRKDSIALIFSILGMTIYMMLGSLAFSAIELDREKENLRDLKKIMETQAFQFVDFLLNETAQLVCEANRIQAQSCQVDAFNKSFYHQHMFDFVSWLFFSKVQIWHFVQQSVFRLTKFWKN